MRRRVAAAAGAEQEHDEDACGRSQYHDRRFRSMCRMVEGSCADALSWLSRKRRLWVILWTAMSVRGERPEMTVVPAVDEPDFGAETVAFWAAMADAATGAITNVSPENPHHGLLHQVARDARAAARLPAVWS